MSSGFVEVYSQAETLNVIASLVQECTSSGGHLCSVLKGMFDAGDYRGIVDFSFNYSDISDATDLRYARQIQALLQKQDFIDMGVDRRQLAYEKFMKCEEICRETNERFFDVRSSGKTPDVAAVLYHAQCIIDHVLGEVPSFDTLDFSFGPGANTSVKAAEANSRVKLSARLECSTNLFPHAERLLEEAPGWRSVHTVDASDDRPLITRTCGKLTFVPKSCLIDRAICVEPILNSFLQKGIGGYIRDRLLEHGLDLSFQEPNQRLALQGSIDGSLATLDLSSASDCLSYGLVMSLLPEGWFNLLDMARTDVVSYRRPGQNEPELIILNKFSSMGNAYTFELETLIFWALCDAVLHHLGLDNGVFRCFGDDIVIPTAAVPLLTETLTFCGFILNQDKSFWEGPFRESCGADYFNGTDIRPFYLKTLIGPQVLFVMHNWFLRHCEPKLAKICESIVPQPLRIYGPDRYGDGHLIGDWTPRQSRKLRRAGWEGGFFDTYVSKPKLFRKRLPGDWVYPSYSIYVSSIKEPTGDVFSSSQKEAWNIVRGSIGYSKISVYTLATGVFCP